MLQNTEFSLLAALFGVFVSGVSAVLGYQLSPSGSPSHDSKVYTTTTTTQAPYPNPAPSPSYSPGYPSPASHSGSSYRPAPPHYTTTTTTPAPYEGGYGSSDDGGEPAPVYPAPPAPYHGYVKPPAVYPPSYPSPSPYPSPPSYDSSYPKPYHGGYPSPGAPPPKPKVLQVENLNEECQPDMDRDVLDPVVEEVEGQIASNQRNDITRVINLGWIDDQRNGKKPLTALRQAESLVVNPDQSSSAPQDIKDRAIQLRQAFPGNSIGAYTDARGVELVREHIADFLWARDGYKRPNASNIYIANGRLDAFRDVFSQIRNVRQGKRTGILMADPNNAEIGSVAKCNDICVTRYQLNEDDGWVASISVVRDALEEQAKYCNPTILYIMQPGFPIGRIYRREELEELIKLAYEKNLIILNDEGYQDDIISTSVPVVSVRKVAAEMKAPYDSLEIITIISSSYGVLGEPGQRSAAYELLNLSDDVLSFFFTSVNWNKFCSNTAGQIVIDFLVNPPKRGDASWPTWQAETSATLNRIRKNAEIVYTSLLEVNGLSTGQQEANEATIIKIDLPAAFIAKADSLGIPADVLFTQLLIRRSGVKLLPGSWFQQLPNGNNHIRISLSAPTKDVIYGVGKLIELYVAIVDEYGGQEYPQPPSTTTDSYATPGYY